MSVCAGVHALVLVGPQMAGRVHGHGRWRSRELERSGRSDLQVEQLEKEVGRWCGRPWWLAGGADCAEESKAAA